LFFKAAFVLIGFLTLLGCATNRDQLVPMVLESPVTVGWFRVAVDSQEWKSSNVGFGLSVALAELWYDELGLPLADPTTSQRNELSALQTQAESPTPDAAKSVSGPLVFGRVVWAGTQKSKTRAFLMKSEVSRYLVQVQVSLYDPATRTLSTAAGFGEAQRAAGSVLFSVKEGTMDLDDTAGAQAARVAIRQALQKLKLNVSFQRRG